MADEIIDLTRYLRREPSAELPRGSMTLWGADGERARFALPLWRVIHLAQGDRGLIVRHPVQRPHAAEAFVALDLGSDPARTTVPLDRLPRFGSDEGPSLVDMESDGLVVFLGARAGQLWLLLVDGGEGRAAPLPPSVREDVLFLAGECAGLLFLRDLAEAEADDARSERGGPERGGSSLGEDIDPDA
jgi:hypothetical protein